MDLIGHKFTGQIKQWLKTSEAVRGYTVGELSLIIQEKISSMIERYRREMIDIEDVEFEEYDLEEDELFNGNIR